MVISNSAAGMSRADTLVEILQRRAALTPNDAAFSFVEPEGDPLEMSYAELDRKARAIASHIVERGASEKPILILQAPGAEYIASFFGCLYAKAIAVPAYPPHPAQLAKTMPRIATMIADCKPAMVLTVSPLANALRPQFMQNPLTWSLRWLSTDILTDADASGYRNLGVRGHDLAFLQYTSGSTAEPKGVMISHDNLWANIEMIRSIGPGGADGDVVSWLPPYHDMGLIGGILTPICRGARMVLMAPATFLQKPIRWLEWMHRTRAAATVAPPFAFALCLRKVSDAQIAEMDLSNLETAYIGAEPIRAEMLDEFSRRFAPAGFRPRTFLTCYGLAEGTLLVTAKSRTEEVTRCLVHDDSLKTDTVRFADGVGDGVRPLIGSGKPHPRNEVCIVDVDSRRQLADGGIGEIWVRGPSVALGYWGQEEKTRECFGATLDEQAANGKTYLRTGDLGFFPRG